MQYKANKGGHAPGHLREAFSNYIDEKGDTVIVGCGEEKKPLRWLLGQLWNCTDVMPSELCSDLDLVPGSSYSMGVRKVARDNSNRPETVH